jgi:hypothetical protein
MIRALYHRIYIYIYLKLRGRSYKGYFTYLIRSSYTFTVSRLFFHFDDFTGVRFEVFTAVTMNNAVFWDVAPCRCFVNRRFGGTYHLHIQGIRNPRLLVYSYLFTLVHRSWISYTLKMEAMFLRNVG